MSRPFFIRLIGTCLLVLLSSAGAAFTPEPSDSELESKTHYNDPLPTTVLVRVVAHRSLVLGHDVGGARVTITDMASGQLLASGLQQGEPGDQTQIMRTPHLMDEPVYSGRPAASFSTTLELTRPTLVEITAEGPLAYPNALQRASTTVLLIPGHDLTTTASCCTCMGTWCRSNIRNRVNPSLPKKMSCCAPRCARFQERSCVRTATGTRGRSIFTRNS
jgi:hypothetical protein